MYVIRVNLLNGEPIEIEVETKVQAHYLCQALNQDHKAAPNFSHADFYEKED